MELIGIAVVDGMQVLGAGLLLGAGLPMIFALGLRALAWADGQTAPHTGTGTTSAEPSHGIQLAGRLLGVCCFVVVVLGVLAGLAVIVAEGFGLDVSFGVL